MTSVVQVHECLHYAGADGVVVSVTPVNQVPAASLQPALPRQLSVCKSRNQCLAPPSTVFRSGLSTLRDSHSQHHQADAAKHHEAQANKMSHLLRNEPSITTPPELLRAQRRVLTYLQPELLPACFASRPFTSQRDQGTMASFARQPACWGRSNQAQLRPASKALPGTVDPSQPVRPRHALPAAMVSQQESQACGTSHCCQDSLPQLLPATSHQRPSSSQSDVPQPTPSSPSRARLMKHAAEHCVSHSVLVTQGPPQATVCATPLRCRPSFSQAQSPAFPYHKPARTSANRQKGPPASGLTAVLRAASDGRAEHNAQQAGEPWHASSIPVTSQTEPVAGAFTPPGAFPHHPTQPETSPESPNASPVSQARLPEAAQYELSSEHQGSPSTSLQGVSTQRVLPGIAAQQPAHDFADGQPSPVFDTPAANAQAPLPVHAPGTLTSHQQKSQDVPDNMTSRQAGSATFPPTHGPQLHASDTQPPQEQELTGIPLSAHGETPSIAWQSPANGQSCPDASMRPSDDVEPLQKSACDAQVVPMPADNSNAAYRRPSDVAVSPGNAFQSWTLGTDSMQPVCSQNLQPPFKCAHHAASTMVPQNDPPIHLRASGTGIPVRARWSLDSDSAPAPGSPSQAWRHGKENVPQECPQKLASGPKRSHHPINLIPRSHLSSSPDCLRGKAPKRMHHHATAHSAGRPSRRVKASNCSPVPCHPPAPESPWRCSRSPGNVPSLPQAADCTSALEPGVAA